MARCGCAGASCNCFITAGSNVTITGAGTVGSPWVINASETTLGTSNTSTLNLSLVSNTLSGTVKVDGASGNLITVAAGGLRVDCTAVTACVAGAVHVQGADSTTVDTVVTGDGSSGTPYTVTSTANISPTSGNQLTSDSGGLYVPTPTPIVLTRQLNGSSSPGATAIPATNSTIDNPSINITNPSGTITGHIHLNITATVTCSLASTQGITIGLGSADLLTFVNSGSATETYTFNVFWTEVDSIAPGGSFAYGEALYCRQAGAAGGTYSATSWQVAYILVGS